MNYQICWNKHILYYIEDVIPKFQFSSELPVLKFYGNGIVFSNGDVSACLMTHYLTPPSRGYNILPKTKQKWRCHRKLSNPAFNRALSPIVMGEVVLKTFEYLKNEIYQPVDIYEILQRLTIEVLGQVAFGYSFGVSIQKNFIEYFFFFIT